MNLEAVIRNAIGNPACALNNDHSYEHIDTGPHFLVYKCRRCGNTINVGKRQGIRLGHGTF